MYMLSICSWRARLPRMAVSTKFYKSHYNKNFIELQSFMFGPNWGILHDLVLFFFVILWIEPKARSLNLQKEKMKR